MSQLEKEKVHQLRLEWCKGCGICIEYCPKSVLGAREDGKVKVVNAEDCVQCRLCELRCPDYAIRIKGD